MNKVLAFFQMERMYSNFIKRKSIHTIIPFRSTEMLTTIDRISRTNPFFTQNFSMLDIDSLPDMYETMIDRPAFIYDSFSNLSYSFTKNLTTICTFFVQQLNYTYEECELLFNNTSVDINHVRKKSVRKKAKK